jgi:RNA polymerase sigma factor (sigma-70 family)
MDKTVEKMNEDNKKLVYKIANSIYIKNKLFSKEDLIQVGFLALCKSGHKYDETRGKISTFITHCVRNDILKFIKSQKQQSELLYADNNSFTYHGNEFAYTDYYDLVNAKTELEIQIRAYLHN